MCEEGGTTDADFAADFAEIIGSVFSREFDGVAGILDSVEGFLSFATVDGLPADRQRGITSIKMAFTSLIRDQSTSLLEVNSMVLDMIRFKATGLALAKRIDNEGLVALDQTPHEIKGSINKCARLEDLARTFIRGCSGCDQGKRRELAQRVQVCFNAWLALADKVQEEQVALREDVKVNDATRSECEKRIPILNKRVLILTGTVVVLGLMAATAGTAAPILAGGASGLAITVAVFAGLSFAAKAAAVKLLAKSMKQRAHYEATLEAASSAGECFTNAGNFLREVATALEGAKGDNEELMAIFLPALGTGLQPKGGSLDSISNVAEGRNATDVILIFRDLVGQDSWSRQCAAWEEDVVKLAEVQGAIFSYMRAAEAASYMFAGAGIARRMTE